MRHYVWEPTRDTLLEWYGDSAPRWAAAIAFYTLFSLAPILIVSTVVAGLFWDDAAVRAEALGWIEQLIGEHGATQVERLIDRSLPVGSGLAATLFGVAALIFGGTVVFGTLRQALNAVWGIEEGAPGGLWGVVRGRLLALALLLSLAVLILASLIASTVLSGWGEAIEARLPIPLPLVKSADLLVSFALLGLLFAAIFKWLPDVEIAWRDVWIGAGITALLFVLGKVAIGFYLGRTGLASAYGVAGSIVLLLLWVYYSAMIFLLGAEATQVYSRRWGSRIRPAGEPAEKRKPTPDGFVAPVEKG